MPEKNRIIPVPAPPRPYHRGTSKPPVISVSQEEAGMSLKAFAGASETISRLVLLTSRPCGRNQKRKLDIMEKHFQNQQSPSDTSTKIAQLNVLWLSDSW